LGERSRSVAFSVDRFEGMGAAASIDRQTPGVAGKGLSREHVVWGRKSKAGGHTGKTHTSVHDY
jgi:hypothetical protein